MIFAFAAILFVEDGVPYFINVKGEKGKLKSKERFARVLYICVADTLLYTFRFSVSLKKINGRPSGRPFIRRYA